MFNGERHRARYERLRRTRTEIAACLAAAIACSLVPVTAADGVRRALLIGCTEFPEMKKLYGEQGYEGMRLKTSANDAELLRGALVRMHGFDAANCITLAGWDEANADARPTKKNIEREFARLATAAGKGDVIVIFLASHCTQLPVPADGQRDPTDTTREKAPTSTRTAERDGYDEVFFAADAGKIDWERRKLPNGIFDHEFATWIQTLRERGALVVAIVSTPHAAGLLDVSPEMLLKQPSRDDTPKGQGRLNDLVAIYSCHADESGGELATNLATGRPYGHFALAIDNQMRADGVQQKTYRQLMSDLLATYKSLESGAPTPACEGELDRAVLSGESGE